MHEIVRPKMCIAVYKMQRMHIKCSLLFLNFLKMITFWLLSIFFPVFEFLYFFSEAAAQRCSVKKMFLKFWKFTGKYLCQSLFLIKFHALGLKLYSKRDSGTCVSVNFAKFLRTHFFTEHLRCLLLFFIHYCYAQLVFFQVSILVK